MRKIWTALISLSILSIGLLGWRDGQADAPPLAAVHTLRCDDAALQAAQAAGFEAIVQLFSWREIEPTRDEWHWEYSDSVLWGAEYYGLQVIVRLDRPPHWTMELSHEDFVAAYARFVRRVVTRYQGRVAGYIIWNEPNLAREWRDSAPAPAEYAQLLCAAYEAIREIDAEVPVVSAGLAPTNDRTTTALDDRVFLAEMHQHGAGACYSALGVHPYGFAYPPDDPAGAHDALNFNRLYEWKEIKAAHGQGDKPLWATELGWTTDATGEDAWLAVTPRQQADYLVAAWRQARRDFPQLEVFTVWCLEHPDDAASAGYSLLDAEGNPRPAYNALQRVLNSPWHRIARWLRLRASLPDTTPALAVDEVIHIGDSE